MIRIRHSSRSGLAIEGSVAELTSLHDEVMRLVARGEGQLSVSADTAGDPAPYAAFMGRLVIETGSGATVVEVIEPDGVRISASPANLDRLASFIQVPADATAGWHTHYEYHPGNPSIAPRSMPVVFSLRSQA